MNRSVKRFRSRTIHESLSGRPSRRGSNGHSPRKDAALGFGSAPSYRGQLAHRRSGARVATLVLTEFLTISKILKRAPAQYARSFLLTEQDEGDLTHFFLYHLKVVARAITELHIYLGKKAQELREVQLRIRATPGAYNYRQLALLEHAVKSPDALYTAESHARSHNVSEQSARNDLAALEQRQLLRKTKVGKRFAWVPEADIADKLKTEQQSIGPS